MTSEIVYEKYTHLYHLIFYGDTKNTKQLMKCHLIRYSDEK